MLLSNEDIERIKKLGFDHSYFVFCRDSWSQLKNYDGRCVFNNGKQCLIYNNRPEGCKLYPKIYDEDKNCAKLDEYCPHRDEFEITKSDLWTVFSFITKLNEERRQVLKHGTISID